jgi:hypothetical protein
VPVVSRKGLCVHEKIKDIPSINSMNEKCQELNERSKCPYNDPQLNDIFSTNLLVTISSIHNHLLKYRMKYMILRS